MVNFWQQARYQVQMHAMHDEPLDNVRKHFLDGGRISELEWAALMVDPKNPPEQPPRFGIKLPARGPDGKRVGKPAILTLGRKADQPPTKDGKHWSELTIDDFPCPHRGKLIELRVCKPCDGGDREVFQCSAVLGGECTLISSKLKNVAGKIPGCTICELRTSRPTESS